MNNHHKMPWQSMSLRNTVWLVLSVICVCSLTYLWLNLKIASYQDWHAVPASSQKPLSRRKPALQSDEYYHGSGPSLVNLVDLLAHCYVALQLGGRQVISSSPYQHDATHEQLATRSKGKTQEGADDLITEADYRSHVEILSLLGESYPRLRIVSEEADAEHRNYGFKHPNGSLSVTRQELARLLNTAKESMGHSSSMISLEDTLVWIDPLDATKEYSEGLTQYVTLMACIVHKGQPIAGIIYKPFIDKVYWTWSNVNHKTSASKLTHVHSSHLRDTIESGAMSASEKKKGGLVSERPQDFYKIIISRSHAGDIEKVIKLSHVGAQSQVIAAGGSGYKTIELLTGHADAYVHMTHIKKWDICAPCAIIHSFPGAQMTDLNNNRIRFDNPDDKVASHGLIATTKVDVHKQMLKLIREQPLKRSL